jgi:hypothetical protein
MAVVNITHVDTVCTLVAPEPFTLNWYSVCRWVDWLAVVNITLVAREPFTLNWYSVCRLVYCPLLDWR